jgi:hypothetical protein
MGYGPDGPSSITGGETEVLITKSTMLWDLNPASYNLRSSYGITI